VAVNDAWVMDAWAKSQGADGKILMLADGSGEFAKAMGLEMDGRGFGLGMRSKRYAAVIENGTITDLEVDEQGGVDLSSCANILTKV
jgi:peroxiredoxin